MKTFLNWKDWKIRGIDSRMVFARPLEPKFEEVEIVLLRSKLRPDLNQDNAIIIERRLTTTGHVWPVDYFFQGFIYKLLDTPYTWIESALHKKDWPKNGSYDYMLDSLKNGPEIETSPAKGPAEKPTENLRKSLRKSLRKNLRKIAGTFFADFFRLFHATWRRPLLAGCNWCRVFSGSNFCPVSM